MFKKYKILTCLIIFFLAIPVVTISGGTIPFNTQALPVIINAKGKDIGSGFYFTNNDSLFLVSAAHVFLKIGTKANLSDYSLEEFNSQEFKISSWARDAKENTLNIFNLDVDALLKNKYIYANLDIDTIAIKIGIVLKKETGEMGLVEGVKIITKASSGVLSSTTQNIRTFNEVNVSDDVYLLGFPSSLGLKGNPQFDYRKPLLRKGIVSQKNLLTNRIIIDGPVYKGNSGSPVIEKFQKGISYPEFHLIGFAVEYVPFILTGRTTSGCTSNDILIPSNSGYAVVVPMDAVIETIN